MLLEPHKEIPGDPRRSQEIPGDPMRSIDLASESREEHTVKPFFNVVVCVLAPRGVVTGEAKPLFNDRRADGAARLRTPWARFNASRRDAI